LWELWRGIHDAFLLGDEMVYTFGGCRSTKDDDLQKFLVFDCDGNIREKSDTLREAEAKADKIGCAFVIKILRLCGGADAEVFEEEARFLENLESEGSSGEEEEF